MSIRAFTRLDASFANIVVHYQRLKRCRALSPKYARLYQSFAQELQAEINQGVMGTMEGIESHDSFRYGKVRQAWEREITDSDDVLLRAEERRREMAQQRKQSDIRGKREEIGAKSNVHFAPLP